MNRTDRKRRERLGRWRPLGERLEARLALSGLGDPFSDPGFFGSNLNSPNLFGPSLDFGGDPSLAEGLGSFLTVVGTDPAPGMKTTEGPKTISVAFDRPIGPFSLYVDDVFLERIAPDGSSTRLDSDAGVTTDLDASRTRLVLTLPRALDLGTYRIVLSGASFLSGDDFSMLDSDGHDRVLGTFSVVQPGVQLSDAIDLGTLGAQPGAVAGRLDLMADPTAVALYRFTIPTGGHWRLGAEVAAQRDGSPLDTALALFDADGRLLSVASDGRPDFPADPYLFAELKPGTYYLGISAEGNLPGQPGGYDPATGRASDSMTPRPGGPFTLRFVADPSDTPTSLLDFGLDRADSRDPSPTGFHLQFSAALRLPSRGSEIEDVVSHGLEVVDDLGRSWPIAAVGYDESQARLSLLFLDRLPAGHYTVRLPATGGLTDLAGRAPHAPGQPDGVLGRFSVGRRPPHAANDLGALYPSEALAGISRAVDLGPGESIDFRFVNLYADQYSLQLDLGGGPLTVSYLDPTTGATTASYHVESSRSVPVQLETGDHILRFTADGTAPVRLHWLIFISAFSWERLLQNGVGQGPALELRLIAPSGPPAIVPSSPSPVGSPPPSPPLSSTSPAPGAATSAPNGAIMGPMPVPSGGTANQSPSGPGTGMDPDAGATATGRSSPAMSPAAIAAAPRGPAGLFLAFGGQPVGRPVPGADSVRVVGPEYGPGAVALAVNPTPGLGQTLDPRADLPMLLATGLIPASGPATSEDPAEALTTDPEAATAGSLTGGAIPPGAAMPAIEPVPIVLDTAGPFDRLALLFGYGPPADAPRAVRGAGTAAAESAEAPAKAEPEEAAALDELVANLFASPLPLVVAAIGAEQVHRAWQRWRHRRHAACLLLPLRPVRPAAPHGRQRLYGQRPWLERAI